MPDTLIDQSDPDLVVAREVVLQTWLATYDRLRATSDLEAVIMDEAHDLAEFSIRADTRTATILLVSFLEDALKNILIEQWGIVSTQDINRYFGSNGPLSTFSQRTLVAKGLNWLTTDQVSELNILRKIRNVFAHNHRVHSLVDPELNGLVSSLKNRDKIFCNIEKYKKAYDDACEETRLELRLFCAGIFNVSIMIANAKTQRARLPLGFRPGSGWDNILDIEQGLTSAAIRYCWHGLGLEFTSDIYQYRRTSSSANVASQNSNAVV
jgi:hypothetical protein